MEAHFGKKDSGPPGSLEDEPEFQALLTLARGMSRDRQAALMDVLMEDMLAIPPLAWDLPDIELDLDLPDISLPDISLPDISDINKPELKKALDATPKEETDFPRIAP